MFWTVIGITLVIALLGAWLYDRRFGHDMRHRDPARHNEAEGYRDVTRFNDGSWGGL